MTASENVFFVCRRRLERAGRAESRDSVSSAGSVVSCDTGALVGDNTHAR